MAQIEVLLHLTQHSHEGKTISRMAEKYSNYHRFIVGIVYGLPETTCAMCGKDKLHDIHNFGNK